MADVPYVLRPSALERLPLSIRRVANAVCAPGCSLDDRKEMQNIINNTPVTKRGQFLPVFFAALDPTRIPAPHDLEIPSSWDVVNAAREALGTICTLDIPSTAQLALWSRGLVWLQFILAFEGYFASLTEFPGPQLCVDFIMFSKTLTQCSVALTRTTPGFLAILAHAWMLVLEIKDLGRQALGLHSIFTFLLDADHTAHYREEIIEGAGGLDALAALVIDSISLAVPSSLKGSSISIGAYNLLYNTLYFVWTFDRLSENLTPGNVPPLSAALALRNIVECLTIALSTLVPATNIESKSAIGIISVILTSIFQSPGGHQKIPDAARHGFFHSIIANAPRQLPEPLGIILHEIIAPCTVYYTVLRGISEPFYEVQKLATSESFRVSPFSEIWSAFSAIVSRRLQLMRRFDDRAGVSPRGCDNPKCCKIGEKTEFRRCSVCKAFHYCSKNCQLGDWLRTHRRACPTYRDMYQNTDEHFTSRERAFLRFLLHDDYLQARANILRDQIPILRDDPKAMSFTLFDYADGPTRVETFPISAALEKVPSLNGTLWSERVSQASESDGRMELHVVVLRDGANERCWVVPLRANTPWARDALPRLPSAGQHGEAGVKAGLQNLPLVQIH